jgi:hypothetical protein
MSRASPVACPRLSLIVLKSSRSRKSAATEPELVRAASAASAASTKRRRLVRPVSGSWNAW